MKAIHIRDGISHSHAIYHLDGSKLEMVDTGGCTDALAANDCEVSEDMADDEIIAEVWNAWTAEGYEGDPVASGLSISIEEADTDMVRVIEAAGFFACGSEDAVDIAKDWLANDFSADEADAWLEARVFDADRAWLLANEGITPVQMSEGYTGSGYSDTLGYHFANNDISLDEVLEKFGWAVDHRGNVITIKRSELGTGHVCPRDQGQMVERTWYSTELGPVLNVHDRSTSEDVWYLYDWSDDEEFEPWNGMTAAAGDGKRVRIE